MNAEDYVLRAMLLTVNNRFGVSQRKLYLIVYLYMKLLTLSAVCSEKYRK